MAAILALLRAVRPDPVRWAVGALLALLGAAAGLALFGVAGGAAFGAAAALVWLRLLAPGRAALRWAERLATHDATFRHLAALRLWLFRRMAAVAPARFEAMRTGDLLNRMTADIDALDALHLRLLLPLAVGIVALVGTAGVLLAIDAALAATVAAGGIVAFALVPLAGRSLGGRAAAAAVEGVARLRERIVEGLHGQADLAVYQAVPAFVAETRTIEAGIASAQRRATGAIGIAAALTAATAQLAVAAILAIGLGLFGAGPAPVVIGAVLLAAVALFDVLAPAGGALVAFGRIAAAARRLMAVVPDARDAAAPATAELPASAAAIRLDRVTFAYAADRPPILRDASLTVAEGEAVAIEGPTGSGKSTIAALILKLREPSSGTIRIGDADLRAVAPEAIWRRSTVLAQRFALFAGTVRDNLAVGDPQADDGRLLAALDGVALGDWLRALPEGLDSWLGEAGCKLSGGQARRVALARCLLADRPLAILDEPTDGLDAATEAHIVATLNQWRRGRTLIVISHRPALRHVADRVLTLRQGTLCEVPT